MAVLLVLEGADRVGKSTLARHISAALDTPVYHFGAPDKQRQAKVYQYQYYDLFKQIKEQPISILDRSWISGLFYSLHRRRQSSYPDYQSSRFLVQDAHCMGFDIIYFFVARQWDDQLIQEHKAEILANPKSETMSQRWFEHHSWPGFIKYHSLTRDNYHVLTAHEPESTARHIRNMWPCLVGRSPIRIESVGPEFEQQPTYRYFTELWAQWPWSNRNYSSALDNARSIALYAQGTAS